MQFSFLYLFLHLDIQRDKIRKCSKIVIYCTKMYIQMILSILHYQDIMRFLFVCLQMRGWFSKPSIGIIHFTLILYNIINNYLCYSTEGNSRFYKRANKNDYYLSWKIFREYFKILNEYYYKVPYEVFLISAKISDLKSNSV